MSKKTTITAKSTDHEPVAIEYPMPESVNEAIEMWGDDVCFQHLTASVRIALQSFMRSQMGPDKEGNVLSDAEIQKKALAWKPGLRPQGKTRLERSKDLFAGMTPEERKAALKELQASMK